MVVDQVLDFWWEGCLLVHSSGSDSESSFDFDA